MKSLIDHVRFFLLLVTRGSMKNRSIDFSKERKSNLVSLPSDIVPAENDSQNWYGIMLRRMLKVRWMRFLLGNIAFLKNPEKSYRKFFVCDDKKLIYLRIFKCGSTSVLKGLLPFIHKPLSKLTLTDQQIDSIAHYLQRSHLTGNDDYTSFTIIRNPLERVVSAYVDIFTHGDYGDFLFGVFRRGMSFNDVIKTLAVIPDRFRGPHFISQSAIIKYSGLKNLTCFKLREDNERLINFLTGFNVRFDHSNKSGTTYDFRNFYDAETLQLVYNLYKSDFIDFNFVKQYEELLASLKSK